MRPVLLLAAAILASSTVSAQTPFIYPLEKGDQWEYQNTEGTEATILTRRVESDTLFPDGIRYALIRSTGSVELTEYERQEGARVFRRDPISGGEYLIFDFSSSPGDTIAGRLRASAGPRISMQGKGMKEMFGRERVYAIFCVDPSAESPDDEIYKTVYDGVGITRMTTLTSSFVLTGARVAGRNYGFFGGSLASASRTERDLSLTNYPNPFIYKTSISYLLPRRSFVRLSVIDPQGREVTLLANDMEEEGNHTAVFTAGALDPGIYLIRLQAEGIQQSRRIILQK